jgi:hypothetical protein
MDNDERDKVERHRLVGMLLYPIFRRLRYMTEVEVDLAQQKQLVDITVVYKDDILPPTHPLPPIFWQVFGTLNEYNLITFKSYSESFNAQALEELYGHLTNFCKVKGVRREQVNLYAIVHHFPRDLLGSFHQASQVTKVGNGEAYDLALGLLWPVRFILCQQTDNPILALFSGNPDKVFTSYDYLRQNSDLLDEVSVYFQKIVEYYGEEMVNMYTEQDFWRDYPPKDQPFAFPWEEAYHKEVLAKATAEAARAGHEAGVEEGREEGREEERKATARTMRELGMGFDVISKVTGFTAEEIQAL